MAVGLIVSPTSNFPCKLEIHRRNWCLHNSSVGSLIFRKRVQSPSVFYRPPRPRVSVLASSSPWMQKQGLGNEQANNSSPYKLSSIFLDILVQRRESGLSNDLVELQGKDAEDWDDKDSNSFVRRRRDGQVEAIRDYDIRDYDIRDYETSNQEDRSSSSDPKVEDDLWSGEERREDSMAWSMDDEDSRHDLGHGPEFTISKSYPSIPAKFSKYTKGKHPNRDQSRSAIVKQQQKENHLRLQPYFKQKTVFFQDFVPAVIKPDHPCQFSYSEHPKVAPIGLREPVYSPFGPENMARPWTGKRPFEPTKRAPRQFDSFNLPPAAMTKVRKVAPPGPFLEGTGPCLGRTREEILGEPLSKDEVRELVAEACVLRRRKLDLGKDGLTHNMLDLLHRHWKRRRVCRIKCYGVPTVDMNNLCSVIEEKSGGKIIRRSKSMLYVFRGRNYNWNTRPQIPLMLWKPPAPIYPPVVQRVPGGLSVEEADNLRALGRRIHCLCRLKRAGMYQNMVKMVKDAFEIDELVKVDCRELERSDMKKIGAKLRDLVPCVPLSFDRHFMLLWRVSEFSQNKNGENISGAATEPYEMIISENGAEVTPQDDESDVHDFTQYCSNRKDEHFGANVNTEIGSLGSQYRDFTLKGTTSDLKSEDILLQEQLNAKTADLTSDKELTSENEDQVSSKANTRDSSDIKNALAESEEALVMSDRGQHAVASSTNATAVMATKDAISEFDRLWQTAIDSKEVVVLKESESDLNPVLTKVKSDDGPWDIILEEKPSDCIDISNLGSQGGIHLDSLRNTVSEVDKLSRMDKGNDEDLSTLVMWRQTKDVDEHEDDGVQTEATSKAEELLAPSLTDIPIPRDELERLCALRSTIRGWMTIGTEGVTRGIVKSIHSKWLVSEIAKVRCTVPGRSMRKVHDDLERLTGGIVVWREGPAVVIYRGKDYVPGWIRKFEEREEAYRERLQSLGLDEEDEREQLKDDKTSYDLQILETEIEDLLDDLGPQYTEWNEDGHVPVDGDLLLPPNSGFKSPFRRLLYGVRPRLSNFEMTEMRHLAKKLPPHFALGKCRGLEGLASAIVKLWEKSEVVKVVMKRGVSRIDNDRMAAELMRLIGGDLITRNMTYIALFRGNDFLPPVVKRTLEEKSHLVSTHLEEEERTRLAGFCNAPPVGAPLKPRNAGTLAESLEEKARWDPWKNGKDCSTQIRKSARDQALQRMQRLLSLVAQKIDRTERELKNLDLKVRPKSMQVANEQVSEEEIYTLRKIGLRMKSYLLLGRREVFGGIIENMHLNWKWRELVKIIVKKSYFMYREKDAVEQIARMLEIESGGVVVGICSIPVGQAIIVYRGKNYQRPTDGISPQGHPNGLRPRGLLTKREAWQRFNQKRRKRSLERHLQKLERDFKILQADMKTLEEEDNEGRNSESSTTLS